MLQRRHVCRANRRVVTTCVKRNHHEHARPAIVGVFGESREPPLAFMLQPYMGHVRTSQTPLHSHNHAGGELWTCNLRIDPEQRPRVVSSVKHSHQSIDVLVCLPNLPQRRLHVIPLPCKRSESAAGHSESHLRPTSLVTCVRRFRDERGGTQTILGKMEGGGGLSRFTSKISLRSEHTYEHTRRRPGVIQWNISGFNALLADIWSF